MPWVSPFGLALPPIGMGRSVGADGQVETFCGTKSMATSSGVVSTLKCHIRDTEEVHHELTCRIDLRPVWDTYLCELSTR